MKTFILVSVVLAVALAAPMKDDEVSGPKREKKSASYGPYGPAPALAPASLYGPVPSSCGHAQAPAPSPMAFYIPPIGHMPSAPHYRENEHAWESLMFSDQEEHPQDRSYGGYGPVAGAIGGGAIQAAASGPALGLFPNANIGGCAVPILVSCSPSITKGQIMKSQHASYSAPSYGYRNVDFNTQMRIHEDAMQKAAEQQARASEMERDAAAAGMGQMHQPTSDVYATHSANGLHGNHMHHLSHDAHARLSASQIQEHHG